MVVRGKVALSRDLSETCPGGGAGQSLPRQLPLEIPVVTVVRAVNWHGHQLLRAGGAGVQPLHHATRRQSSLLLPHDGLNITG